MDHPVTPRSRSPRRAALLVLAVLAVPAGPVAADGAGGGAGGGAWAAQLPAPDAVAKDLFGAASVPADLPARAIGSYSRGCLAGGRQLVSAGGNFQLMRPSRNRAWGHPSLIAYVERLAADAPGLGWNGLLVGDLAQPRGGPMTSGHASHQVGLDVDVWLLPMPQRRLSDAEREGLGAPSVLAADQRRVDPSRFTEAHARLLRRAASDPAVARIFVHPAIKRALCAFAGEGVPLPRVRPAASAAADRPGGDRPEAGGAQAPAPPAAATAGAGAVDADRGTARGVATAVVGPLGNGDADGAGTPGDGAGAVGVATAGMAEGGDGGGDALAGGATAGAERSRRGAGDRGVAVGDGSAVVDAKGVALGSGGREGVPSAAGGAARGAPTLASVGRAEDGAETIVPPEVWLRRIRPWYGHHRHFHVRLACPQGEESCRDQAPPPEGTGCGRELDWWFTEEPWRPATGGGRRTPVLVGDLPAACEGVLLAR